MTEHTSSYYAASANKYAPFDTLNESISCDVCVVGGGYTGLSSHCIWRKRALTWWFWKPHASALAPAGATAGSL